jgi:hypothetical protein
MMNGWMMKHRTGQGLVVFGNCCWVGVDNGTNEVGVELFFITNREY